jgi:transcriptional regulator with XRE-family HTH domain
MKRNRIPSGMLSQSLGAADDADIRRTRDRMLLACRITETLRKKGITQKRFAQMLGKRESEVSEWLSGNRNFTIDTLSDISDCLGITLIPTPPCEMNDLQTAIDVKMRKKRNPDIYKADGVFVISSASGGWQNMDTISDNILFAI